jgi:hypothetical protein
MSGPLVRTAAETNTVYKGFRWALLDRSLPDDTIQTLDPTVDSATRRTGFVAMLRLDRSRIEKVFCDQKAAAEDRQFKAKAAICSAIKNGARFGGHYFAQGHDCGDPTVFGPGCCSLPPGFFGRGCSSLPPRLLGRGCSSLPPRLLGR